VTEYETPHRSGALPNWHSTFSANADTRTSTVHARGSLDLLNVELLRGAVEVLITAGRLDITVDLAEINFVDQAGVLLLGGLRQDLDYRGGNLTLINARPAVQVTLRRANLIVETSTESGT
jgi:anti-anti-sigma factor